MSQDCVGTKHRVFIFVVVVGYLKNRCEKLEKNLEPLSEQVVNNDKSYTQLEVANHAYCG